MKGLLLHRRVGGLWIASCVFFVLCCGRAVAADTVSRGNSATLTGKVSDASGLPVEGAMVFIYSSPAVRQSADFMSAPTEKDGIYRLLLPPGRYWAVARLKKSIGFGPLMPGDKHSGEPLEVDLMSEKEVTLDFTVTDLREAMNIREKTREVAVRVTGRIVDEKGISLGGVYAVAGKRERMPGVPDYLSAWSDADGRYTLYVPKGTYYLGSASAFPPGQTYVGSGVITVDGDKGGVDIVRNSGKGR